MKYSAFLLLAAALLVGGCADTSHEEERQSLQGKILNGRYAAADSFFSCQVPPMEKWIRIEDYSAPGFGAVFFRDMRNNRIRVEVSEMPLELTLKAAQKQENAREILTLFFEKVVKQTTTSSFVSRETLDEEFIPIGHEEGFFSLALENGSEAKDFIRGYLITIEGDQLVTFSVQSPKEQDTAVLEVKSQALTLLKQMHSSFRNKLS